MKLKLILFTALVIFMQNSGFSQRIALKLAFSKPDFKIDNFKQDNSQLYQGFQIGIYGRSDSRIYFQPEVYYQRKKGRYVNDSLLMNNNIRNYDQTVTLHTINVPLLLGINFIRWEKFTLHGFFGVQSSIIIDNSISNSSVGYFSPITKSNLENITVKYFFGGGIDIYFLSLDVRYYIEPGATVSPSDDISFPYAKNYYTFNIGIKLAN
jgi:hypothetical protein